MHNHNWNGTGERKGFTFTLMEIVRLGCVLGSIIAMFVTLQGTVGKLSDQVHEMREATQKHMDLQDGQIRTMSNKIETLAISSELQHNDMKHMGGMLHEKRILRSPDVTYSQAQTTPPEPEPSVEQPDEPKKRNAALRALKATGHVLIKPFKETPETPEDK